ncbi:hypothetical protein DAI22_06g176800 [Oryza sativa Japonica Group]|nr:hypothetical protein DAI22_06g176800 [Oryza sativa Japonica Group]
MHHIFKVKKGVTSQRCLRRKLPIKSCVSSSASPSFQPNQSTNTRKTNRERKKERFERWHFPPRHHRSRPTPSSSGCRTRDGGGALAATFRIPPQLERTQQVGRGLAPSGGVLHLVLFVAVLCRLLNQRRLARTVASNDDGRNPMGVNMGSSMV